MSQVPQKRQLVSAEEQPRAGHWSTENKPKYPANQLNKTRPIVDREAHLQLPPIVDRTNKKAADPIGTPRIKTNTKNLANFRNKHGSGDSVRNSNSGDSGLSEESLRTSVLRESVNWESLPTRQPSLLGNKFKSLRDMTPERLIAFLNSQIIGRSLILDTVFGPKLKLYLDYTASGQELRFLVDLMMHVEDYYANTHTETSATGAYMNNLLNEAEAEILKAMKASSENYFVVGGGSGSTFAIEMAQKFLGTYIPPATKEQILKLFPSGTTWQDLKNKLRAKSELPLVIVSHYEHHSNEVTWRGQLCDIVEVPPRIDGHIDLDRLEAILSKNHQQRPLIGSFSAGSNVTGIKTDVFAVAAVLKKYNALAFFDYAAVGPYVAIDLSRKTKDGRCLIDGIYISPHKFLGGPGACGVLVFNRKCYLGQLDPSHGGGGTVDYVGRKGQMFTEEPTHREKSGTPGILQIIKAGLAFQLKSILQPVIEENERRHLDKFYEAAGVMRNLQLLGPHLEDDKVGIMSFLVQHNGPKGRRYLHQNFVIRLLNDLFGIQGRSGCSCAGPYGHFLLNIDDEISNRFRFWLAKHPDLGDNSELTGFKPGWARVNLHFTITDFEIDYLMFALNFICKNGHRFLPLYTFNPSSGQWKHVGHKTHYPIFGFETLLSDEHKYAESEVARQRLFEKQKQDASLMLEKLPPSKELDSLPEMPYCFFYVEKGMVLDRNLVTAKAAVYEEFYPFPKEDNDSASSFTAEK